LCIIASVPRNTKLTKAQLSAMWDNNPHGGGIAYIDGDEVKVFKTLDKSEFINAYFNIAKEFGERDMLVHTRIKTHGDICIDNVHPFQVNENTFMAHNGTIDEATPPSKFSEKSDTNWFVEHFMSHFDITALDDPHFIDMLGNFIGGGPMEKHQWYGNKLVFLTADKRTKKDSYVVNAHLGQSPGKGIWFSNGSFEPKTTKIWSNKKSKSKSSSPQTTFTQPTMWDADNDVWFDDFDSCDISFMEQSKIQYMKSYWNEEFNEFSEVGLDTLIDIEDAVGITCVDHDGFICYDCGEKVTLSNYKCTQGCKALEKRELWFKDNAPSYLKKPKKSKK